LTISLTLDGQEDKIPSFNEVYYCRCEEQEKKWQYRTPLHPGNIKKCNAPV
jgi:hypothetical protein